MHEAFIFKAVFGERRGFHDGASVFDSATEYWRGAGGESACRPWKNPCAQQVWRPDFWVRYRSERLGRSVERGAGYQRRQGVGGGGDLRSENRQDSEGRFRDSEQ